MTHFSLENDINNLLRMDAPLTKVPLARWQRKALEASLTSAQNNSLNQSNSIVNLSGLIRTPKQTGSGDSSLCATAPSGKTPVDNRKTPSGKTNSKTPISKLNKTPKKPAAGQKTPGGGDRFIPNRSTTRFDLGHFKVTMQEGAGWTTSDTENAGIVKSPHKHDQQKVLSNALHGQDISTVRIISYAAKAPAAPEGFQSGLQVVYCNGKTPSSARKTRYIPQAPDRILDAPDIMDDYYLNILDWSCGNLLAVALYGVVYLWNATTGDVELLMEIEMMDSYVSSLSWIEDGTILAIGTSSGDVQLWDVRTKRKLRSMTGRTCRVGSLSWNEHILTSGARDGTIVHHDVRRAEHVVSTIGGHTMEVCGLRWSPDRRYLATGGNDNIVNVYSAAVNQRHGESTPLHVFLEHSSAIKALSWCPWQPSILASGGGTADRCIRLWNVNTGVSLGFTNTNSQVCSILWSDEYRELISGHGFAKNQLILWKYPAMTKVAELIGHKARVLQMSLSPDGTTVVSAAADETLRLWKCFTVDPKRAAGKLDIKKGSKDGGEDLITRQRIR